MVFDPVTFNAVTYLVPPVNRCWDPDTRISRFECTCPVNWLFDPVTLIVSFAVDDVSAVTDIPG